MARIEDIKTEDILKVVKGNKRQDGSYRPMYLKTLCDRLNLPNPKYKPELRKALWDKMRDCDNLQSPGYKTRGDVVYVSDKKVEADKEYEREKERNKERAKELHAALLSDLEALLKRDDRLKVEVDCGDWKTFLYGEMKVDVNVDAHRRSGTASISLKVGPKIGSDLRDACGSSAELKLRIDAVNQILPAADEVGDMLERMREIGVKIQRH